MAPYNIRYLAHKREEKGIIVWGVYAHQDHAECAQCHMHFEEGTAVGTFGADVLIYLCNPCADDLAERLKNR